MIETSRPSWQASVALDLLSSSGLSSRYQGALIESATTHVSRINGSLLRAAAESLSSMRRKIKCGENYMRGLWITMSALTLATLTGSPALDAAAAAGSRGTQAVEFEKMTWVEVKAALSAGRTTALIYTGGVEERGPQNTNGGHNLMAHATVDAIAGRLGNAIYLPVLPFSPNEATRLCRLPLPGLPARPVQNAVYGSGKSIDLANHVVNTLVL
jgi:hypothetical protein